MGLRSEREARKDWQQENDILTKWVMERIGHTHTQRCGQTFVWGPGNKHIKQTYGYEEEKGRGDKLGVWS